MDVLRSILVGIDGGGGKTRAALLDAGGMVRMAQGPGAAIVGAPSMQALSVVADLIDRLLAEAGRTAAEIDHLAIGLSGVDYADDLPAQTDRFCARLGLPRARLTLVNDAIVALWGASAAARSLIVQHGTGFTSAWRGAVGAEVVFESTNAGSIFDLRRAAVALTVRTIDGRAAASDLRDRVLDHCGVASGAFADWVTRDRAAAWSRIAGLAGAVFASWRDGDEAAAGLVRSAAADYALTAAAMVRRIGEGPVVAAFGGGVIAAGGAELRALIAEQLAALSPTAEAIAPRLDPSLGAVLLAAHASGADPAALFERLARVGAAADV